MTAALGAPLGAAGVVAVALALGHLWLPLASFALGATAASVALALCAASADASRRVLWSAVAAVAAAQTAFAVVPVSVPALPGADPIAAARSALAAPLRALIPPPESALAIGVVLGDRADIPRDLRDAFAASGTSHLLAVSGFNLTVIAAAVGLVTRGRLGPRSSAAASLAAVLLYTALVGAQPAVLRAAFMASVVSLALASGRRGTALNGLGFAVAAMLALDARTIADVGFVLSAAATGGLVLLQRPIAERLGALPGPVRESVATTLAASVPTLPVIAATFGRVSLVAPIANLAAVPLLPPLMLFGAAASLVGAAWREAAWPLAMATLGVASLLRHAVELSAAMPFASVDVPAGLPAAVATGLPIVAIAIAARRSPLLDRGGLERLRVPGGPARAAAAVALGAAAFAGGATVAGGLVRDEGFRLRALDVGQGDAYLLESQGHYALVDGGPDGPLLMRRLAEVLPPWQRRIDLVVLTHEHIDHGAGLLTLLDRYAVGLALEPDRMSDAVFTRMWHEALERSGVRRQAVSAGAVVRLGEVTLRVLAPDERPVEFTSLVVRAERGRDSVLFMGDATDEAIADVLLRPEALRSRVYVPPHHGAETSYARALAEAVRPEIAVISVGAMNRYGHPAPSALAALAGMPVYRTDRYGTVDVTLDADPLVVHTAKAGLPAGGRRPVPGAPASR